MRLTVGPLPPAVYWRRRVAILGALLLAMVVLFYSCSGASGSGPSGTAHKKRVFTPSTGSPSPTVSASSSGLPPGGGITAQADDPPGDSDSNQSSAPAGSTVSDSTVTSGSCTDAEMTLTATAEPASAARAGFVKFTLRIKNISNRSCTRDVGADPQELYLQDPAKVKVWSSDACDPLHGTDVRTFKPGDVAEFYVVWNGKATSAGCANQQPPPAGKYQLLGRLSTKLSEPAPLELRAG
jgi:hypothetical protein